MDIGIVVAMTRDRVIGNNGKIPWHIREEFEHFKRLTSGNTVIMGKNTWLSLPEKFRPLPDRVNIIVSSSIGEQKGAIVCSTIKEAVTVAESISNRETFCIGGEQLYKAMLPMANVLHISWIIGNYNGDAHFPEINFAEWKLDKEIENTRFVYDRYLRR